MMKSLNQTLEGDATERNALTRKLYRYISEASRRVEEGSARADSVAGLFAPPLQVHRQRLRENCEKLIFADPLLYGRKAQELLWRKGYYEAVAAAKRLRSTGQERLLLAHLESGIGHYHHLIFRAQTEIDLQINFAIDYSPLDIKINFPGNKYSRSEELKIWGKSFVQTCLIYLGDLCRYKIEFEEVRDPSLAHRYYVQAAAMDPCSGAPYNQLGTLYTGRNYHLDSVHYYLCCQSCENPFEGGEANLLRIFDKNSKQLEGIIKNPDVIDQQESVKFLICKFLSLVDCWYSEKDVPDFNELCASTLYDLKECLQFHPLASPDLGGNTTPEDYTKYILQNEITPEYLTPKLINKFVIIILMCVNKLQKESSSQLFPLKAFAFAVLSQLLQKLQNDLVSVGFEIVDPVNVVKSYKERIRSLRVAPAKDAPIENGFHDAHDADSITLVKEDDSKGDTDSKFIETSDDNVSQVEISGAEDKPALVNGISHDDVKTCKNKLKKPSILQKLRRRRRRSNSFDSSDKTGSEDFTDESDFDEKNSDGEDDSSTSDDDNISVNSYSSASSDDEDAEDQEKACVNKENSVESSHGDLHNKELKDEIVPDNKDSPETEDTPAITLPEPDTIEPQIENPIKEFNEKSLKEFLENDNILSSLYLLLNWLYGEAQLIISCGPSGRALFQTLVDILNTIHRQIFPKLLRNTYYVENQYHPSLLPFHKLFFALKYSYRKTPLPEDYETRSLEALEKGTRGLEWGRRNINLPLDQANAVRLLKFLDFGIFIVKLNVGIIYNKRLKLYVLRKPTNKKSAANNKKYGKSARDIHHTRNSKTYKSKPKCESDSTPKKQEGSLMKSLGQLWLREQVRALESEVRGRVRPQMPAYVVLDTEALCQHTHHVKQLVTCRKVIVLIPTIVLQTIDALKKDSGAARSAIRWLELQLRNGSRFIRTQRPTETAPVPCVKYPKKMHRDVQNFIQIIEFCHFFLSKDSTESVSNQIYNGSGDGKNITEKDEEKNLDTTENLSKNDSNVNMVVLLTGSNHSTYTEQKDFSYSGLAQSAGVTVEGIQEFCSKWKHCFGKGSRKR